MPVTVPFPIQITVENPDQLLTSNLFGALAVIRIQSSATVAGTYIDLAGVGSTPTIVIVSGTEEYTGFDVAGSFTTWYRTRYESADGSEVSVDWAGDPLWATRPGHAPFQVGGEATAYATIALFRTYVGNQASTDATDEDTAIEQIALDAAARAIDNHCNRTFRLATSATARTFTAVYSAAMGRYVMDIDDVFDLTGAIVTYDRIGNGDYSGTSTAWRAWPYNAASQGLPYRRLVFDLGESPPTTNEGVQVTMYWGWTDYPMAVVNANLIQANRFLKRRRSPYGIAGSPELGNELRLLQKLDPDVALLLETYKLYFVS